MEPHEALRALREKNGLTQEAMGARLDVGPMWVHYREIGRTKISVADVNKIAEEFKLGDAEVLGLVGREPESAA